MKFENKLKEVQKDLLEQGVDGWLLYDYRHSNPLAYTFLEMPPGKLLTRRFFYWIPKKGEPIKIVSFIEPRALDHLPGVKWLYRDWRELEQFLFSFACENIHILMEYSPYNALPNVSKLDGGMMELISKRGAKVVSSANILQRYTSVWTQEQFESHLFAAAALERVVEKTWAFIEHSLQSETPLNEYQIQQFMLHAIEAAGCYTNDWPTCALNAHSADPHYYPQPDSACPIRRGDFILLDLWCKKKAAHSVYADITRVGVAASYPNSQQQEVFNIVKEARNRATLFIKQHYENKKCLQAWQVDQICRDFIHSTGYGEYFVHRTGHNLGEEVHGPGANLDNLETHDYRELLPGTAFTIEPGIYLPQQFGVRLEYDVYLYPTGKVLITGGVQEELELVYL